MISIIGKSEKSQATSHKSQDKISGFTLVEMLTALVIIALMVSISIPSIAKTAKAFYFQNKMKEIVSLIKYVKGLSILEEKPYQIIINTEENTHVVLSVNEDPLSYDDSLVLVKNTLLNKKNLPEGFTWRLITPETSIEKINFTPLGTVTPFEGYIDTQAQSAKLTITGSGQVILEYVQ